MESRKRRGVGAIMSDETPPSPEKCARDRLQQGSEADAGKQHDNKDAETLEMVQRLCMLNCGVTEEMPLSPSAWNCADGQGNEEDRSTGRRTEGKAARAADGQQRDVPRKVGESGTRPVVEAWGQSGCNARKTEK